MVLGVILIWGFIKIFYVQVHCILIYVHVLEPRHPDLGKRILAVMNDFQICKHLLVAEGDTDTVMFSPRFL